jgi:hypothetical protein
LKCSGIQGGETHSDRIQQKKCVSLRSKYTLLGMELNFTHREMFFIAAFKQKRLNIHVKVALVLN